MIFQNKAYALVALTCSMSSSWAFVPSGGNMATVQKTTSATPTLLNLYPADKKNPVDEKISMTSSTSSSLESSQTSDDKEIDAQEKGEYDYILPSRRDIFSMTGLAVCYSVARNFGDIMAVVRPDMDANEIATIIPYVAPAPVKIAAWPGVEYLEIMMELAVVVQLVETAAKKEALLPYVKLRLDDFFKGTFMNQRTFFETFSSAYNNQIRYDPDETQDNVIQDRIYRYKAMKDTLNSLEKVYKQYTARDFNMDIFKIHSMSAANSMKGWMANIPVEQVEKAKQLMEHSMALDHNNDGTLNESEILRLPKDEQLLWRKRNYLLRG